jgi:hypothetical protein
MKRWTVLVGLVVLMACVTGPSDVTSFSPRQVSPAPGTVIDSNTDALVTISGSLSVQSGLYYTMVYVRDDGKVFLPGEWGPAGKGSSWSDYRFIEHMNLSGSQPGTAFTLFCKYGTITRAVFITSGADILVVNGMNNRGTYIMDNFYWNIVNYQVDIPLNYRCK